MGNTGEMPARSTNGQAPPPLDAARFADLDPKRVHPTLIQTITNDLKFEHMTPVQAATINELLPPSRSDCLVQAKTGTGKTLAFLVPALQTLLMNDTGRRDASDSPAVSILVVSPTRELAMQIAQEATNLLQRLPQYRVRIAIGGTNKDQEEKRILQGCHVLIATPGRLLDHMATPEVLYTLRQVNTLVLDEADRLLDMGFMKELREIVGKLPDKKETNRQGMLFSATIARHVDQAAGLVLSPGYKFISTIPEGEANIHQRVPQLLVTVDSFSNVAPAMVGCIREEMKQHQDFKAILFAPTAALASLYGHILSQLPDMPPSSVLSSRLSQNRRTKITNEFRDARNAVLVATDVVARGMDFPGVTTVFQVGIPADKESYIHRIGRTARAGAEGRGIFIISEAETWFSRWTLKEINFITHPADLTSVGEVNRITEVMDETERAKIYQAWLGYYKNHLKGFKWDNVALVAEGNVFASNGLQCPETPGIPKSTVGKMGLRGTKGLVTIPDPPKARHNNGNRGGREGRRGGRA
jgi:ATP-dependent RNA helicase MSS116